MKSTLKLTIFSALMICSYTGHASSKYYMENGQCKKRSTRIKIFGDLYVPKSFCKIKPIKKTQKKKPKKALMNLNPLNLLKKIKPKTAEKATTKKIASLKSASNCTSNRKFCLGDRVKTKKGNIGTVTKINDSRVNMTFTQQVVNNVAVSALSHVVRPYELAPFPLNSKLHISVENIALDGLCPGYTQCFRMKLYVNNQLFDTYTTTPGHPHADGGQYTPEWTNAKITRVTHANYKSGSYPRKGFDENGNEIRGGAPMPHAIFFNNTGIAIHGSYSAVDGEQHSYGCLRLRPHNAKDFFELVRNIGFDNVTLTIADTNRRYK